ncbi:MAG: hypothetical protein AAFQ80_18830 [Cyanobacteria bacterium J06621_8]
MINLTEFDERPRAAFRRKTKAFLFAACTREFDQIKLIAAGSGFLSGILWIAVEDGLRWLFKGHQINWGRVIYKSVFMGSFFAIALATVSAVEITLADVPLNSINTTNLYLCLFYPLIPIFIFLMEELGLLGKSSSN